MRLIIAASLFTINCTAASAPTYSVLVQDYPELPPYSSYRDGEYTGFNRELLDMFAASRGYQFDYVALPVRRLFAEFVAETGDLKYPDNPAWAGHIKGTRRSTTAHRWSTMSTG